MKRQCWDWGAVVVLNPDALVDWEVLSYSFHWFQHVLCFLQVLKRKTEPKKPSAQEELPPSSHVTPGERPPLLVILNESHSNPLDLTSFVLVWQSLTSNSPNFKCCLVTGAKCGSPANLSCRITTRPWRLSNPPGDFYCQKWLAKKSSDFFRCCWRLAGVLEALMWKHGLFCSTVLNEQRVLPWAPPPSQSTHRRPVSQLPCVACLAAVRADSSRHTLHIQTANESCMR